MFIELFQGLLRIIFVGFNFSVPLGLCYRVDLGLSGHFISFYGLFGAVLVLSWCWFGAFMVLFYVLFIVGLEFVQV